MFAYLRRLSMANIDKDKLKAIVEEYYAAEDAGDEDLVKEIGIKYDNEDSLRCEMKDLKEKLENIEKDFKSTSNVYKDRLLAVLYTDIDYLKHEVNEKNLFIEKLLEAKKTQIEKNEEKMNDESTSEFQISNEINNKEEDQMRNDKVEKNIESGNIEKVNGLKNQLQQIRAKKKHDYVRCKESKNKLMNESNVVKLRGPEADYESRRWPEDTVLIAGDSILHGIDERKLKRNIKVRVFPGSTIEELKIYLTPLLYKKPKTIIIHIATNNCKYNNSMQIKEKYIDLINHIKEITPDSKVVCSSLIQRYDDAKAQMTVNMANKKLKELDIDFIDNSNINESHLGKKGLHLNSHGTGKLALNFVRYIKGM